MPTDQRTPETDRLRELYQQHWKTFQELSRLHPLLSPPHLLAVPQVYLEQDTKLLYVGQQTQGWWPEEVPGGTKIDGLQESYLRYLAENTNPGPFWGFKRALEERLRICNRASLWSNLTKCDHDEDPPSRELRVALTRSFPVLEDELRIVGADVVVFVTAHRLDSHLEESLPGFKLHSVSGFGEPDFSRLSHPSLPDLSFRTHHPANFNRRHQGLRDRILEEMQRLLFG